MGGKWEIVPKPLPGDLLITDFGPYVGIWLSDYFRLAEHLQANNTDRSSRWQGLVRRLAGLLHCAGEGRVPVEMHLYAQGGHAFGLRRTGLPITGWPELVETWLRTIEMISK